MTSYSAVDFVPPSPGSWELEQTHLTRPLSVLMAKIFPPNMMRGFAEGTRAYGVLLDHLEVAIINRFAYMAPRPVGAPKGAKGPPPRLVFEIVRRLHPEIRRRIRRASEVFRERSWRRELEWWDTDVKPSLAKEARALMAEDLAGGTTATLVDHLRRAADFAGRTVFWHHRFNICVMLPLGDFLIHAMDWTALAPEEILPAMRGASPVSAGATQELAVLRDAIHADSTALGVLLSEQAPADILIELEQRPGAVANALRAYMDIVGYRVLGGYDVADRHAREHPELLVKIIRSTAIADDEIGRKAAADRAVAGIRARVPAEHREAFDDLLAESQLVYRLRDERIFHSDAMGIGILRRAVLAAGERLKAQGLARDPLHLVDATIDETVSLLEGRGGPSADELAERTRWRLETPLTAAPSRLGIPPSSPPPAEWLPPDAARMQRVIDLVLKLMFDTRRAAPEQAASPSQKSLKGFGVSPGVYEGLARVVGNISDLPSIQSGEVLVATSTGPTFNVVLPLIGAIVTERGGALSHAAIVAREYGLPGVVGCPGATTAIRTGMRVRVNGMTGEVWTIG